MINSEIQFKNLFNIIWYDGPLFSIGFTEDNVPVLDVFCDKDINSSSPKDSVFTYAYIFLSLEDTIGFINNKISYFDLIHKSEKIVTYKISGEKFYDFQSVSKEFFISNYGPKPTSDLSSDIAEFKDEILSVIHSFSNKIS